MSKKEKQWKGDIKVRIYSHLLNKSLTENFVFCVVNIIAFTTESLASFSSNLIASFSCTFLCRNQFLALAVNDSTFRLAGA